MPFHKPNKVRTGELTALVSVHDLGRAVFHDGFFQRIDAGVGRQAVGQPPAQHLARGPIQYGAEVYKASAHGNVRRVHRPDVVRALDGEVAQQVRINPVLLVAPARIGLAVDRFDAHFVHQRAHVLATDLKTFEREHVTQHSGTRKRVFQMQFIHAAHEPQIGVRRGLGKVIDR